MKPFRQTRGSSSACGKPSKVKPLKPFPATIAKRLPSLKPAGNRAMQTQQRKPKSRAQMITEGATARTTIARTIVATIVIAAGVVVETAAEPIKTTRTGKRIKPMRSPARVTRQPLTNLSKTKACKKMPATIQGETQRMLKLGAVDHAVVADALERTLRTARTNQNNSRQRT